MRLHTIHNTFESNVKWLENNCIQPFSLQVQFNEGMASSCESNFSNLFYQDDYIKYIHIKINV